MRRCLGVAGAFGIGLAGTLVTGAPASAQTRAVGPVPVVRTATVVTSKTAPPTACSYAAGDQGYLQATAAGDVLAEGTGTLHGTLMDQKIAKPVVGLATTPTGGGYFEAAADGGVFAFGDAGFHGSMGGKPLVRPVVGMAATPDGGGYWSVASDGGVFAFGDAGFFGSMGGRTITDPVVGMAATPDGGGSWLVAADGGVFSFGDARFHGSMGGKPLVRPVTGMAATPSGGGYWLVASDGGVFAFGNAGFHGSMGGKPLVRPITGMAATPSGGGYWLTAADGGIFSFGDASFQGTFAGGPLPSAVVAVAAVPAGAVAGTPLPAVPTGGPNNAFGADYYYAGAAQTVSAPGGSIEICAALPGGNSFLAVHTVTELAAGLDPDGQDYIEIIETSSPQGYGTVAPHLSVARWTDGVDHMCDPYGYNDCGFVQVSPFVAPNMILPVGVTGSYAIEHSNGRWNLYDDGQLMGYFPDALWNGAFTETSYLQAFGEVATIPGSTPQVIMGNGVYGDQPGADRVTGYQLLGADAPPAAFDYAYDSVPAYYDVAASTTSFSYGGPGA